jgi:endonuclease/exonuclease/phosphatase family metal-dependent hydrolase
MQPTPESFVTRQGERVNGMQDFITYVEQHCELNQCIPAKPAHSLRLVTFNVHYFRDHLGLNSSDQVFQTIGAMGADLVLLNEMPHTLSKLVCEQYDAAMFQKGYPYVIRAFAESFEELGNVLYSKFPFVESYAFPVMGGSRSVAAGSIKISDSEYLFLGTHLAVGNEEHRLQNLSSIQNFLLSLKKSYRNIFLMGDFNSWPDSIVLHWCRQMGFLDDCPNPPKVTCWTGTRIDYILQRNPPQAANYYTYYTTISDHLPIIADVFLDTQ